MSSNQSQVIRGTDLLWCGHDALEFTEEDLSADVLIELFDLLSDLLWRKLLDSLDENLCWTALREGLSRESKLYLPTRFLVCGSSTLFRSARRCRAANGNSVRGS